ncbi:unnamed protein product [Didymodactylos carnosus]|uniref:Uncharacterized protein n=1 Tax=Didymodactylos carnosus TaxID=1234261 RepID=A0A816BQ16_9BILA|nr:unnamed protein product [Didymodactylos carnosus]CAF4497496.1 unnamed protein product [Didymodactylos carnosus]
MTNTVLGVNNSSQNENKSSENHEHKKRRLVKHVVNELGDLTQHNLKQLKVLNRDVFPVAYNEKFYKDLLEAGELAKLGKYKKIVY